MEEAKRRTVEIKGKSPGYKAGRCVYIPKEPGPTLLQGQSRLLSISRKENEAPAIFSSWEERSRNIERGSKTLRQVNLGKRKSTEPGERACPWRSSMSADCVASLGIPEHFGDTPFSYAEGIRSIDFRACSCVNC
jgi:hypothetical protein